MYQDHSTFGSDFLRSDYPSPAHPGLGPPRGATAEVATRSLAFWNGGRDLDHKLDPLGDGWMMVGKLWVNYGSRRDGHNT